MAFLYPGIDIPARLGYDFKTALDQKLSFPVIFQFTQRHALELGSQLAAHIDDIRQPKMSRPHP